MLINKHQLLVTFSTATSFAMEKIHFCLNGWLGSWQPAENHFGEEGSASQCWQWFACEEAGMEVGARCLDRMDCLVWWVPVTCSSIEDDGVSLATVSWRVLKVRKKCINMDFYNFQNCIFGNTLHCIIILQFWSIWILSAKIAINLQPQWHFTNLAESRLCKMLEFPPRIMERLPLEKNIYDHIYVWYYVCI